jgi:hypothetical protein
MPNVISFMAVISACERGTQWEVLSLLREMPQLILMPNLISFMVGISACEKGAQWEVSTSMLSGISACEKGTLWEVALNLLCEMPQSRLMPVVLVLCTVHIIWR